MYGVVLWTDASSQRAVIWCDDHGDLAFYNGGSVTDPFEMTEGDLVSVDLHTEGVMRVAQNPRIIAEKAHTGLTDALRTSGDQTASAARPTHQVARGAGFGKVIPFRPRMAQASSGGVGEGHRSVS